VRAPTVSPRWPPMLVLASLFALLRDLLLSRRQLILENLALRQQLGVLRRSVKRPRLRNTDRLFWVLLARGFRGWRACFQTLSPETVLDWHRKGFRAYWRRKSRHQLGRPTIPRRLICLIWRLQYENQRGARSGSPPSSRSLDTRSGPARSAATCTGASAIAGRRRAGTPSATACTQLPPATSASDSQEGPPANVVAYEHERPCTEVCSAISGRTVTNVSSPSDQRNDEYTGVRRHFASPWSTP
jgi:hypothetical protein